MARGQMPRGIDIDEGNDEPGPEPDLTPAQAEKDRTEETPLREHRVLVLDEEPEEDS